jgi:hypothetical protein
MAQCMPLNVSQCFKKFPSCHVLGNALFTGAKPSSNCCGVCSSSQLRALQQMAVPRSALIAMRVLHQQAMQQQQMVLTSAAQAAQQQAAPAALRLYCCTSAHTETCTKESPRQ